MATLSAAPHLQAVADQRLSILLAAGGHEVLPVVWKREVFVFSDQHWVATPQLLRLGLLAFSELLQSCTTKEQHNSKFHFAICY